MNAPEHHIFVCTSCRPDGTQQGFCANAGARELLGKFMEEIDDRDMSGEVMLSNTGCFGICDKGPIAVVYPEGHFYGHLDEDGVEEIMDALENGDGPVEGYLI